MIAQKRHLPLKMWKLVSVSVSKITIWDQKRVCFWSCVSVVEKGLVYFHAMSVSDLGMFVNN